MLLTVAFTVPVRTIERLLRAEPVAVAVAVPLAVDVALPVPPVPETLAEGEADGHAVPVKLALFVEDTVLEALGFS